MYRFLLATAHSQTGVSVHVSGGLGLPVGDGLDGSKVGPAFVAGLSFAFPQ